MSQGRVSYIDGIRGWAAVSVLLYHVFWEMLGGKFPEVRSPWVAPIFNGPLAVYVFFVLSGDALSTQFLQTRNPQVLQKGVLYRYFRLTLPVLMSCLMAYLLMKMAWVHPQEAGRILNRPDWLSAFIDFPPKLLGMLKYATYEVYFNHTLANSYNPFLWTMGVELIGSLMVFSYLSVLAYLKRPLLVSLGIFVFLLANKSVYAPFFFGVALSLARSMNLLSLEGRSWGKLAVSWALILYYLVAHIRSGKVTESVFHGAGEAALFTLALYLNPTILKAMQTRLSHAVGELSFPLYLVHFPIIVSLYAAGVIALEKSQQLNVANALVLGGGVCVVCVLVAMVFMRIERRGHAILRKRILPA